jgi:uncharacterized protein
VSRSWTLFRHTEPVAVCSLPAADPVPVWAAHTPAPVYAVVRTAAELSLLCAAHDVPQGVPTLGPYAVYEVEGPLDPSLVGVLAELLEPLADADITVLTMSTYGTDWILVPVTRADAASTAWRRRRHRVIDPVAA